MTVGDLRRLIEDIPDEALLCGYSDKLPLPGAYDVSCSHLQSEEGEHVLSIDLLYPFPKL